MADDHKESYILSRWLFLRALGLIHFVAFLSLAVQILMLNGRNGILPIAEFLSRIRVAYGSEAYAILPTIFWFDWSDQFIFGSCVFGVLLSLLVMIGILTGPSLIILAVIYMSLDNACGEFMAFQSDGLIVEATLLALFVVPWCLCEGPLRPARASSIEPSKLGLFLTRFLLFRLMFAAGVVKILSGDTTWRDLTALSYHQETQPIPTPLAWFVHHLPMSVHKSSVIFTFVAEFLAPLLYFLGRSPQLIGAVLTALLHMGIILTGNYTFLNYLTIVLCIPLIDDAWFERLLPFGIGKKLRYWIVGDEHEQSVLDASLDAQKKTVSSHRWKKMAYIVAASTVLLLGVSRFLIGIGGAFIVPAFVGDVLMALSPYRIFNSYGMFAVMTTTRPEIVIEGSNDGKEWKPYEFKYKVGDDLGKPPPIVAPHMPRLDWRLWFAAMGPVEENPWVLNIAKLLLEGKPEIISAFKSNPFPQGPPKYVRAFVYDYHFSDWQQLSTKGQWWTREKKRVYFPPLKLDQGELIPVQLD